MEDKEYYSIKYKNSAEYKISLYALFMELAIRLGNSNGLSTYIVPDSFLLGRYFSKIRKHILDNCNILNIILIKANVFENAVIGQSVIYLLSNKKKNQNTDIILVNKDDKIEDFQLKFTKNSYNQRYFEKIKYNRFRMLFSKNIYDLINKIDSFSELNKFCLGHTGIRSKVGQKEIISKSPRTKFYQKGIISGGQVHKYFIEYDDDYINVNSKLLYSGGFDKNIIEGEKILIRQTSDKIIAGYDNTGLYHLNNVHSFKLINDLCNVKYIIALLNSMLIDFYYKKISLEEGRTMAQIDIEVVEKFPIPFVNKNKQDKFVTIVDKILNITKQEDYLENIDNKNKVKEYEEQIDIMVYKLYELTYEEVLIIDKDFKLSIEEYDNVKL